ncbi:hypothetical protein [Actinoplanes couchii]|uniref:Uncharacterized protein n=1 Tax=Actinoplanes couchii TaxID=403638 RepID=A0ABQ3X048_9ACTN|nr:hypothetical protein [Actinoplanes couchii]MDR6316225.1 hypothetical protein [Actinoplanes couchii]GID51839.1 hypothetical protein Aco03nite_002430 [Actinoplanes couchii]
MTNPFRFPDHFGDSLQPLDPLEHPEHADLYVDLDGFEAAFTLFQQRFGSPESFDRSGAMAIAVGDRHFGKTALLNRCAYWLRETLNAPGSNSMVADVVDLKWVPVADGQTTEERMKLVCHHLMKRLDYLNCLEKPWGEGKEQPPPEDVLPYLDGWLREDRLVIVQLPPTADVQEELVAYAKMVPRRVILLGETAYARQFDDKAAEFRGARIPPVVLRLGKLRPADGVTFYNKRRELYPDDAKIPAPANNVWPELLGTRPMSVGELQRILYDLYDDESTHKPPAKSVTMKVMLKHYLKYSEFGGKK